LVGVTIGSGLFIPTNGVSAATNSTINYQARLLNADGSLVPDGLYNVEFKIYDSASAGASAQGACSLNSSTDDCWWVETRTGGNTVRVVNGYIAVNLGSVTPFGANIPWDQNLYITMRVGGIGAPVWDTEMVNVSTGRMKLSAVPFAFEAESLIKTDGSSTMRVDLSNTTGFTILSDGANVFNVNKTGRVTLAEGLVLANSTSTTAGTLRWSGTDFEGYDGSNWLSLTSSASPPVSIGKTVVKSANETVTNSTAFQDDNELFFGVGANETWSFRFVVQANIGTAPDGKFQITAPSGASCTVSVIDAERAVTVANLGCGASSGLITGNGTNDTYEIVGTVENGANAGNVTLQWAQNANSGTAVTVLAGSYVFATSEGSSSTVFSQGGNSFGSAAVLGTTDSFGLNIITNGVTAATFTSSGSLTIVDDVTIGNGLVIGAGGVNIQSGQLDLNYGNIIEAGDISGVDSLTGTGALTIASALGGDLTLDSASGTIVLGDSTVSRNGDLTFNLFNSSAGSTFNITNTDGTQVANLNVEGTITAGGYSGNGSGLSMLDASSISSGTLGDSYLSSNVVLLNQNQTFTGRPTFSDGLILGNSTSTTAGAIRWNGSEFQGYDGVQWSSLGGCGGSPLLADQNSFYAYDAAGDIDITSGWTNITLDTEVKEDSSYTHATDSEVITFNEDGWYEITYDIGTYITSGGARTSSRAKLQEDVGSGYVDVPGSQATMYNRNAANGYDSASATVMREFNAGDSIRLQAQSFNGTDTVLTEAETVRITIKRFVNSGGGGGGGGLEFTQGGNDFGANAIIGTTGANDLNLITNGTTALSLTTTNQAVFSGEILANGGLTVGNASTDSFTIVSDSVSLTNGLNFDSNTFVISSSNNRVGIGNANPENTFTVNSAVTPDSSAEVSISSTNLANKGLVIQGAASQSANLLEIQNSSGGALAGFDASGQLILGNASSSNGAVVFNNNTNSNTITIVASAATANRSITLPDADGTLCIAGSSTCGFLRFASGSVDTDATTNDTISINKTGATGNLITLQKNGNDAFVVANDGGLTIRATSTGALDIRTAGGTSTFSVDTNGNIVRIGSATADGTGVIFVLDTKNTTGDPGGVNGAQYYNSFINKFRCFEDGSWKDCIGARQVRSFIDTTADAAADNNTTNYWDTGAENNNSFANVTPSTTNKSITGSVSFETQSATTADRSVVARVERSIGSPAACNSGTPVGTILSTFTTNNGEQASNTMIFLDEPATTSTVYYTLCADTATSSAAGMTINRIRITLEEANNTN